VKLSISTLISALAFLVGENILAQEKSWETQSQELQKKIGESQTAAGENGDKLRLRMELAAMKDIVGDDRHKYPKEHLNKLGGKTLAYMEECEKELGTIPDRSDKKQILKEVTFLSPAKINGREVYRRDTPGRDTSQWRYADNSEVVDLEYVYATYFKDVTETGPDGKPHLKKEYYEIRLNSDGRLLTPNGGEVKLSPEELAQFRSELKKGNIKTRIAACDNPPHAGFTPTPCAPEFETTLRTYKASKPGVYWIQLERGKQQTKPLIGWNSITGASCFLDAGREGLRGASALEPQDHARAYSRRNKEEIDNCLRCHTGSDPFIVTPHLRDVFNDLGIPRHYKDYVEGNYRYHIPGMPFSELEHQAHKIHVKNLDGTHNDTCTQCHQLNARTPLIESAIGSDNPFIQKEDAEIFALKPWMPPQDAVTGSDSEKKAIESIKAFLKGKKGPLPVTEEKVRIQAPRQKSPPPSIQQARAQQTGKAIKLSWSTEDVGKEDDVRFTIKAKVYANFRGKEETFEHQYPDYIGVTDSNKAFPRKDWAFFHDYPPSSSIIRIEYEITPVRFDPSNNEGSPFLKGKPFVVTWNAPTSSSRQILDVPAH
jgi:hypothetical protein